MSLGLDGEKICYNKATIDALDKTVLDEAYGWLVGFRDVYIKAYKNVRCLIPEEQWKWYELHGAKGVWEYDALKEAKKDLLDRWKDRPNAIRRHPRVKNAGRKDQIARTRNQGTARKA